MKSWKNKMEFKYYHLYFVHTAILLAQNKLTLSEAINIGLENNYNLRISQKSVEISEEIIVGELREDIQQLILVLHQLTGLIQMMMQILLQIILLHLLNLSWTLFNGFRIFNTKYQLEDQFELSKGFNAVSVENTIQSIVLAYFDVLLQKERLTVFEELESLSKDRYRKN